MTDLQIYLTVAIFGGVILLIALDAMDMAVAALLGVSFLLILGLLETDDLLEAVKTASASTSGASSAMACRSPSCSS